MSLFDIYGIYYFFLVYVLINVTRVVMWNFLRSWHNVTKHAYSNLLRILPPKTENFQMKKSGSFHISAQNINCGYLLKPPLLGGSNENPQSMFLSRNMKINIYPM